MRTGRRVLKWVGWLSLASILLSIGLNPLTNYLFRGRTGDPDIMAGHDWAYWQCSMHWGKVTENCQYFLAYLGLALLLAYGIGRLVARRRKARDA